MRYFGFFITLFGIIFTIMIGSEWRVGDMWVFFNWPTLIFFLFVITGTIVCTSGYKTFLSGINAVLSKKYQMIDEQRDKCIDLFTLLQRTVTCAALILVALSIVLILLRMDDPSSLGPNLAIAILSIMYGAFINMALFNPAIHLLKQKREDEPVRAARIKDKEAVEKLLQLCFQQGLTHEDIMAAEEITLKK